MNKAEERGFFELVLPGKDFFAYLLEIGRGRRQELLLTLILSSFSELTLIGLTKALITLPMSD